MTAILPDATMAGDDSTWPLRAKCRNLSRSELNDFFAADNEPRRRVPLRVLAAARRFCHQCPVRAECGAEADANHDEGLWGGAWRYRTQNAANERSYRVIPIIQPPGTPSVTVPAGPVRRHVRTLLDRGWTQNGVAAAAQVHRTTVIALLAGENPRMHAEVAESLLAVRGAPPVQGVRGA
jgi:hypothetical protein